MLSFETRGSPSRAMTSARVFPARPVVANTREAAWMARSVEERGFGPAWGPAFPVNGSVSHISLMSAGRSPDRPSFA